LIGAKLESIIKDKWAFYRKSWFNCTVDELWRKRENNRYMSSSIIFTGLLILIMSMEGFFIPEHISNHQVVTCFLSISIIIFGLFYSTSVERIDMWIYLKIRGNNNEGLVKL
jgi:hypothetical protein